MTEYLIGLMAGTSLDGVDSALVGFDNDEFRLVACHYRPFPKSLKGRLQNHCFAESLSLQTLGQLDADLGELFGHCVMELLDHAQVPPHAVVAIGSHGQTLYHSPDTNPAHSLQIGDPNRIAEITGITTISDFRRRDIAAGGQGAPLVPAFHRAAFQAPNETRVILNLGGIANVTCLPPVNSNQPVTGFDTGPGNTILNQWIGRHRNQSYDRDGNWGRSGKLQPNLLEAILEHPFFSKRPPKSTGPEMFSLAWLENLLENFPETSAADIQATLTHLTAASVAQALGGMKLEVDRVIACGGGVHNGYLLQLLSDYLPWPLIISSEFGIEPDWVEAMAFAWLARQRLLNRPGNLPEVTGAKHPVVLGGIYGAAIADGLNGKG